MKSVTVFEANDGSRWPTANEALRRDALLVDCQAVDSILGPATATWKMRVNHGPDRYRMFKEAVVKLCRRAYPNEDVFKYPAEQINPFSYAGRLVNETGGPLNKLWFRLSSMTTQGMEYEQPYFVKNEHEFTGETVTR